MIAYVGQGHMADVINMLYYAMYFLLEIRWRLRIKDAETSSNF